MGNVAGIPVAVDRNQFTSREGTVLGLDAGRFLSPHLEARVHLTSSVSDAGYNNQPDGPADTLGFFASTSLAHTTRRSADARVNAYLAAPAIVTVGVTVEEERERQVSASQSQYGPSSDASDRSRQTRAGYVQLQAEPWHRLAFNAGGRVEDNDAFGTFLTYRVGAAWRLPAGARIRAAIGTGFKEPSFFENYATGFVQGNPGLAPERSTSWEVAWEQQALAGHAQMSAGYFSQRFRDLIQFTFAPSTPGGPNYFNIAAANASGVELGLRLTEQSVTLSANYTYLHTEVIDAGFDAGPDASFIQGARLLRRPTHLASARASVRLGSRGALSTDIRHTGGRDDLDFGTFPGRRIVLPAYTTLGLGGEYELTRPTPVLPGFTVTAHIENLFDASYREAAKFPARGRTVLVGGRVNY